jgi:hypothetical protein
MRDLQKELATAVEAGQVLAWEPNVGDIIVGSVMSYDTRKGYQGREVFVVTLEVENPAPDGPKVVDVWLTRTVLLGEFKKLRPAPGERVGIAYCGPQAREEGEDYELYKVTVDREGDGAVPDFERSAEA